MAPITQVAAAACFAAFCSVRTAFAQSGAKSVAAPDEVYTDANLARRGRMTVLIPAVTKSDTIVQQVVSALPAIAGDNCANVATLQATAAGGFFVGFQGESPKYAELFQAALETGLAGLTSYPTDNWGTGEWSTNNLAANLGYLLNAKSTEIGCAITQNCTPTSNVLLCRLSPAPASNEEPFSKEYYSALKARNIKIQDMSSSDINPDGSGASFPSLLLAGFVGVMALASI